MGIEDIQISEELETNAPSIKYRGDEGPKSPQQEKMMMLIQKLMSQGMGQEEAMQVAQQMMAQAEQQQMSQQQMAPQGMPPRQMAAFGGIMGMDGRREYGLGSSFKKFVRKIIPNEVAKVAEVAAPFVAPFNPIAAGLMSGIGGFDRTGKIGSSIKSGLMNYGMGQLARGVGGGTGNLQTGFNPAKGFADSATRIGTGFGKYFSSPTQSSGGLGKMFADKFNTASGSMGTGGPNYDVSGMAKGGGEALKKPGFIESITNKISSLIPESTLGKVALGGGAVALGTALLGQGPEETIDSIMNRGGGIDTSGIRTEVIEAFKDETGEKLLALRAKYPYLGTQRSKNQAAMAMGGRIGYMGGGMTMGDPRMMMPQSRMPAAKGGLMDVMDVNVQEQIDTPRGNENIQMADRETLEFIYDASRDNFANDMFGKDYGDLNEEQTEEVDIIIEMELGKRQVAPERMMAAEGGLMDLGGMEKDYRAEGGFVPIGAKEKADDVPARLSVNEFVFTADAVRNAGGGDIDKGAEVMENMMKNLEQGGQVSEESQGMQGARDMFATSQRLSEVV